MYPTAEVRWFYEGTVPRRLLQWLAGRPAAGRSAAEEQPPRIDYYLFLPGDDSLGIKLRQGRLELKQRLGQLGQIHLPENISGLVELWRKWSFPLAGFDGNPLGDFAGSSSWIAIKKRRRLRRYRLGESNRAIPAPTGQLLREGCEFELTSIQCASGPWWTVAIEAFGDEAVVQDHLLQVAAQLLPVGQGPPLEAGHSYGYPRWLQTAGHANGGPFPTVPT